MAARVSPGGSIPARAGEPPAQDVGHFRLGVYPRACGGTVRQAQARPTEIGLSPRVRGNQGPLNAAFIAIRSIPARAGEPAMARAARPHSKVYPRACGGTQFGAKQLQNLAGLSPRVRGNRAVRDTWDGRMGSIPARAGEPSGASSGRPAASWAIRGLSPRVRGNPSVAIHFWHRCWSIPARAGEPRRRSPG